MIKFLIVLSLLPSFAVADIFDTPKVQTVLQKKYDIKDELTAEFAYLPKDAFAKYIGFGLSYSHAFSDFTSWEMVNGLYLLELTAGLKKQLIEAGFSGDTFASQRFQVTSNIVFSPVYTKNLLFNSSIVYSQFSFAMGAGVANFSLGTFPVIDAGLIFRFHLNPSHSFKFDLRYNKYLSTMTAVSDNYTVILGYTFNLRSTKEEEFK